MRLDHLAVALYTAGVRRAVTAYAADQLVRAGLCSVCGTGKKTDTGRRCNPCCRRGWVETS